MPEPNPPSPEELAAFLDGSLEGDALKLFHSRVADDPEARRELVEAARLVRSASSAGGSKVSYKRWLIPLAAAAAFAVVMLKPEPALDDMRPDDVERSASNTAEVTRVDLIYPPDADTLSVGDRFVWRGSAGATYRMMISDRSGRTAFQASTTDTVFSVPASLEPGLYYWTVDALAPDGSSATSGAHELVISAQ